MITAIIRNKENTLILELPHSIYDIYEKLQSIGIMQPPKQIPLTDNEDENIGVKLFSESDFGQHLLLTLNEKNTIADANMLTLVIGAASEDIKEELEQNILYDQYDSMDEVINAVRQMTQDAGPVKAVFFCPLVGNIDEGDGDMFTVGDSYLADSADEIADALNRYTANDENDMAKPHIGKKNLLKLDITDFFGSISFEQVLCAAFNTRYVSKQVGFLLTSLCCKNDALPQGSPTSPVLSNIVMRRFDDQIGRWCNQRQITYTRYCDDMTFSADRPLYGVYKKVKTMLREMGFELNESKTHFISNADRQTVTGLVVNEKLSIPSSYKRSLRQEIYYTLKFGIEDSIVHGNRLNFLEDGQPIRCPTYMTHLIGSVQYVLQIEPENRWFLNAKQKLLDYARAYFRAEGLGEEYYLHRSRLREKDE